MFLGVFSLLFSAVFVAPQTLFAAPQSRVDAQFCERIATEASYRAPTLQEQNESIKTRNTQNLASYLSELFRSNVINREDLEYFKEGLLRGEILNPVSGEDISGANLAHLEKFEELISMGNVDISRLNVLISELIESVQKVEASTLMTNYETAEIPLLTFTNVPAGSLTTRQGINIEISNPTIVSREYVTDELWAHVMRKSALKFSNKNAQLNLNGETINFVKGRAIFVSPGEHLEFLQRLNLIAEQNPDELARILHHHESGDRYRYPTIAEWMFFEKNGFRDMERLSDVSELGDRAAEILNEVYTGPQGIYSLAEVATQKISSWIPFLNLRNILKDPVGTPSDLVSAKGAYVSFVDGIPVFGDSSADNRLVYLRLVRVLPQLKVGGLR